MPKDAPAAKLDATRGYGAHVVTYDRYAEDRDALGRALAAEQGLTLVPPYDDERVIAGQGTVALELLEDFPQLDCILCPVGGGGLASGISLVIKALAPATRVIAVEPALADDAYQGFHATTAPTLPPAPTIMPPTLADGLRGMVSERTLALLREHVDDIVTVSEQGIVQAMRMLWDELHVIVEPSSAVPFAALLEGRLQLAGQRVAIVLTGGNVDLDRLPWSLASAPQGQG
jgi:threonine dehydratase